MKFNKYDSLINDYRLGPSTIAQFKNETFVCTEKVHGANLQFRVSKDGVRIGKRNSFLEEDNKDFFKPAIEAIKVKYLDRVQTIYDVIGEFTVYGELYGGSGDSPIQKEITYCQEYEFYPFDIMQDGKYLPYDQFEAIIEKSGGWKTYAKQIFKGTLRECLDHSCKFDSLVSKSYGIKGNTCEGIVIKSYSKDLVNKRGQRFVIKKKNHLFKETKMKTADDDMIGIMESYVTQNRFNCLKSKEGEFSRSDIGKCIRLFRNDILEEVEKDGLTERWKNVDKKVRRVFGGILWRFIDGQLE